MDIMSYYHSIDYNLVSHWYFIAWKWKAALTTGLLLLFILTPFFTYSYKSAAERCKKLYPDENVIYVVKCGIIARSIITILIGGFFGAFMLTFFVFENLYAVGPVNLSNIYIYGFIPNCCIWSIF